MKSILASSLSLQCARKIQDFYVLSVTRQCFSILKSWFDQSMIGKALHAFPLKESTASTAITFRLLRQMGNSLDFFAGKMNTLWRHYILHSLIIGFCRTLKRACFDHPIFLYAVTSFFFSIGYALTKIQLHSMTEKSIALTAVLLGTSFISFAIGEKLKTGFLQSATLRLIKYIFE